VLVDIIIAARNYGGFIGDAIASALAQQDCEVLVTVIDDGSTDNTAQVVAEFDQEGVRYLRFDTCRGVAAARNAGIASTTGPFIAFLDADDVLPPDRTAHLLEVLQTSGADYAYGVSRTFVTPHAAGTGPTTIIPGPAPGTLLIRREMFEKVGLLDETVDYLTVAHWLVQAQQAGATGVATDRIVVERRFHDSNISRHDAKRHSALAMVHQHLATRGERARPQAGDH
jgi:glycosyltransferase involved in cell wall biosynthesis